MSSLLTQVEIEETLRRLFRKYRFHDVSAAAPTGDGSIHFLSTGLHLFCTIETTIADNAFRGSIRDHTISRPKTNIETRFEGPTDRASLAHFVEALQALIDRQIDIRARLLPKSSTSAPKSVFTTFPIQDRLRSAAALLDAFARGDADDAAIQLRDATLSQMSADVAESFLEAVYERLTQQQPALMS